MSRILFLKKLPRYNLVSSTSLIVRSQTVSFQVLLVEVLSATIGIVHLNLLFLASTFAIRHILIVVLAIRCSSRDIAWVLGSLSDSETFCLNLIVIDFIKIVVYLSVHSVDDDFSAWLYAHIGLRFGSHDLGVRWCELLFPLGMAFACSRVGIREPHLELIDLLGASGVFSSVIRDQLIQTSVTLGDILISFLGAALVGSKWCHTPTVILNSWPFRCFTRDSVDHVSPRLELQ